MKKVLSTMLTLLVLTLSAFAQTNTGRLLGTISDPSGLVPGATVVVIDNKTAKERTVVASDDGSFTVPQIQDLPLNGRDPTALITLQAGTASNGATTTSVNGQRSSFTNITRDGINIQDNYIRANASDFTPQRPTVDDVAEFTITTQNASA